MVGSPHSYTAAFPGFGTRGPATAPNNRLIRTNAAPKPANSVIERSSSMAGYNIENRGSRIEDRKKSRIEDRGSSEDSAFRSSTFDPRFSISELPPRKLGPIV